MENPVSEGGGLDQHKNKQIKPINRLIAWCVSIAKGFSVHICRFGIGGIGTGFRPNFEEKTTIQT